MPVELSLGETFGGVACRDFRFLPLEGEAPSVTLVSAAIGRMREVSSWVLTSGGGFLATGTSGISTLQLKSNLTLSRDLFI